MHEEERPSFYQIDYWVARSQRPGDGISPSEGFQKQNSGRGTRHKVTGQDGSWETPRQIGCCKTIYYKGSVCLSSHLNKFISELVLTDYLFCPKEAESVRLASRCGGCAINPSGQSPDCGEVRTTEVGAREAYQHDSWLAGWHFYLATMLECLPTFQFAIRTFASLTFVMFALSTR